jgi:hypothetical protein
MTDQSPEMLKPTLVAGVACGVLASIPFLGDLLICFCCSPILACGFMAAYLYSNKCKSAQVRFSPGTGATVGLISGAFCALTYTICSGLKTALMGTGLEEAIEAMEQMEGIPPEVLDGMRDFADNTSVAFLIVLVFFFMVILSAIFSTIGGLIGGAVFRVEPKQPEPGNGAPPAVGGE